MEADVAQQSASQYEKTLFDLKFEVEKHLFHTWRWFIRFLTSATMSSVLKVPSTDRNALNSLWGKLASEILMQNWEAAMEDLTRLRETIDNNVNAPLLRIWYRI